MRTFFTTNDRISSPPEMLPSRNIRDWHCPMRILPSSTTEDLRSKQDTCLIIPKTCRLTFPEISGGAAMKWSLWTNPNELFPGSEEPVILLAQPWCTMQSEFSGAKRSWQNIRIGTAPGPET